MPHNPRPVSEFMEWVIRMSAIAVRRSAAILEVSR